MAANIRPTDPLSYNVPIVDENGHPTPQFIHQWAIGLKINETTDDLTVLVAELRDLVAALQSIQIIPGAGLTGGGTLTGDVNLDTAVPYTPASRQITAGAGLTGGGNLTADRSIALSNTGVTAGSYGGVGQDVSITVNAQGQITAIANA